MLNVKVGDHVKLFYPVWMVSDIERTVGFGNQKINLQLLGQEPRNRAQVGSGDVCLITRWPLEQVMAQLACHGVEIVEGPVTKSGACGPIESIYFLDPDQNLIEVSRYP